MGRVGRFLAALTAYRAGRYLVAFVVYSVVLVFLGKSVAYLLSWLFLPFALLFVLPVQLAIGAVGPNDATYVLVAEVLACFAVAFAIHAKAPNASKWIARAGLILCFAQIALLLSEKGVGR